MKLAKLSLAAILAAGAFSVANATSLEDAIKGVDLSGYAFYRFHDDSGKESYSKTELRAQLTAPVQENIQFVTRFTANRVTHTNETSGSSDPLIDRLFFNYTGFENTTVTLGRMYVGTPLDDTAGLGLKVVTTPTPGLTLAAAYFWDNSAVTNAAGALAAIYSNDMFNARAWYISVQPENSSGKNGADFIFVEGGVNVGPVALKAQYATKSPDVGKDSSTIRIQASGKYESLGLRVGYVNNDKDGGDVTVDGSAEGDNDLIYGGIYGLVQINEADEEAYFGEVTGSFGKFGVKVGYVSYDNGTFDDQFYGQVSYALTKKMSAYVRYGTASYDASGMDDKTLARFQTTYKF